MSVKYTCECKRTYNRILSWSDRTRLIIVRQNDYVLRLEVIKVCNVAQV